MKKSTTKQAKSNVVGQIVHRLPGRVRVRIDRLHNDIKYGDDLKQTVAALRGVTEVRINTLASSIVINYQSGELPEQKVLDCLGVSFLNPEVAKPSQHPITDKSDTPPDTDLVKEAEKFTAEITGESIGEVVGETVGEILMGPIGAGIGAEVGAEIGGEVGESIGHAVEELLLQDKGSAKESAAETPPPVGGDRSAGQEHLNSQKLPRANPPPNRHSQKTPRQKK